MSERPDEYTQAPEDALEEPELEPDSVRSTDDAQELEDSVEDERAGNPPTGE